MTKLIVNYRNFENASINATFITVCFPFEKFMANKMGMPKAWLPVGLWQQVYRWSQKRDMLYAHRSQSGHIHKALQMLMTMDMAMAIRTKF
jgi:hypothetical protein